MRALRSYYCVKTKTNTIQYNTIYSNSASFFLKKIQKFFLKKIKKNSENFFENLFEITENHPEKYFQKITFLGFWCLSPINIFYSK